MFPVSQNSCLSSADITFAEQQDWHSVAERAVGERLTMVPTRGSRRATLSRCTHYRAGPIALLSWVCASVESRRVFTIGVTTDNVNIQFKQEGSTMNGPPRTMRTVSFHHSNCHFAENRELLLATIQFTILYHFE